MSIVLENYVNCQDAAAIIGCTDAHVRRMLIDGKLRGKKVSPSAWMIERKDAERIRDDVPPTGRPRSGSGD